MWAVARDSKAYAPEDVIYTRGGGDGRGAGGPWPPNIFIGGGLPPPIISILKPFVMRPIIYSYIGA